MAGNFMKRILFTISLISIMFLLTCKESEEMREESSITIDNVTLNIIKEKIKQYVPTHISADLTHLTERQRQLIMKLVEAGKLADEIFWQQTSHDAIETREFVKSLNPEIYKDVIDYVMINYGPYDAIDEDMRFIGDGPEKRPPGGNFYPIDMTKEEFEKFITENPDKKADFENQYTVIKRKDGQLIAIPYHQEYPQVSELAKKLEEAAELADDPILKKYLYARAKAILTDDYYESDMIWMDMKNNDIDLIIGPIENYEDALFNYKTAYEAVIMVKDFEASKELEMFNRNIQYFQKNLPCDKKYIGEVAASGTILQVVNVVYFGGDCQRGIKTIAAALPNDPRVYEKKGSKKSMFKNMMEAKFENIVVPIAQILLDSKWVPHVDKKAFTSFVTLHEVSHTLGRGYVYGNKELTVRKALKERYSAIEECKADILSMYNHKHLLDLKEIDENYLKKAMATYLAGLYRSIRFGIESAHGKANMMQLNFLRESGAIYKTKEGKLAIDESKFFKSVADLANIILTIQAKGDYVEAGKFIDKYCNIPDEIKGELEKLKDIPTDLNTTYDF